MKRVARSVIAITVIAASLLLARAGAVGAEEPALARQLAGLGGGTLSDSQLAAVSARGTPTETGSAGTTAVIIWDEPPGGKVISQNISTGHGANQSSTVSIRGR